MLDAVTEIESHPFQISTIFAAVTCVVLLLWRRRQLREERHRAVQAHRCQNVGPSHPHKRFLLGLDYMFENALDILRHCFAAGVHRRFQLYGSTHSARILHRRMVNTIDPENLEAVMKTNCDHYDIIPGREKLMRVIFGTGVFSTNGMEWKTSRSIVRQGITNLHIDFTTMEEHFQVMLGRIRAHNCEEALDFGQLVFDWTFAVATRMIIGELDSDQDRSGNERCPSAIPVYQNDGQFAGDFRMLGRMARALTIMISQIPHLKYLMYGSKGTATQNRVLHHIECRINQVRMRSPQHKNFVNGESDELPKRTTVLEGLALMDQPVERLRSECAHLLLAGSDTVGIALSELIWCLAKSPHVWHRLRTEIKEVLGDNIPSTSDLKKLPYLGHVINEGIRVRPTLSVHGRRANRDTVLPRGGGAEGRERLFVPKGTYVVYSNYALYRDADVFGADIESFRPERWEEGVNPARYEFLSFGAGPRHCPGKVLGWTMVAYAITRMAQMIEQIESCGTKPWEEATAFSFHNRHGVHLKVSLEALCSTDHEIDHGLKNDGEARISALQGRT